MEYVYESEEVVVPTDYGDMTMVVHKTGSGDIFFYDDFPTSGPHYDDLAASDKAIVNAIVSRNSVVIRDLGVYIFCTTVASWSQIQTSTAAHELAELTGIDAPVNYMKALSRVMPLVQRVATSVGKITTSLCINTYRMIPTVELLPGGPIVTYSVHGPIVDNRKDPCYMRQSMFVVAPLVLPMPTQINLKVVVDLDDEVLNDILYPLDDHQKIDFLWRLGNMLQDPQRYPCTISMYGRWGTEGKSAFALNMTRMLRSISMWSPVGLIGKGSKWPDAELLSLIASKRLIIDDEADLSDDVEIDNIKKLNSGSPIEMGGSSFMLNQTVIGITNKMGWFKKDAVSNSMGRRYVIYKMTKDLQGAKAFDESRITNQLIQKFVALAIAVSNTYERSPMTLMMALYTVFRKSINWVTAGLIIDDDAPPDLAKEATCCMASRCGVTVRRLISCFSSMSPDLVHIAPGECRYIKGIRTRIYAQSAEEQLLHKDSDTTVQYIDVLKYVEAARTF